MTDPGYLTFPAVGCPDFPSPSHGTAIRTGEHLERLTIYCNTTGEMRHLVCSDTKWIGEIKKTAHNVSIGGWGGEGGRGTEFEIRGSVSVKIVCYTTDIVTKEL